jgi:hypothetical protein
MVWVVLAFSLAIATGSGAARAQGSPAPDRERLAAAHELMVVAGSAQKFDAVVPFMMQRLTKAFVELAPQAEKQIQSVMDEMLKRFSARKGELIEEIAGLFAEKLTLEEIRELTRFYSTGVGAKFIAMQPELTQRSLVMGQRWGEKIGSEIEAEARRELKKLGVDI